jgi:hypothetical protein
MQVTMHRTMTALAAFALVAAAGPARADKGGKADKGKAQSCTKTAMRKARGVADKAMKAKVYKKAIAALEPFRSCDDTKDPVESAWLAGDLAVAYWKDGQLVECRHLMEPLVYPKSDIARNGNDKIMNALQYNLDQCEKEFDAQYSALKSDACALTIDDAVTAVALPAALAPKGAAAACLALVPGTPAGGANANPKDDDDSGLPEVVCPRLAVISKGKGAKLDRQLLGGADDQLAEQDFCCGLNRLAVGVKDGKTLIRIGANEWTRECHGGTATMSLDSIIEWKGTTLTGVVDASNLLW